MSDSYGIFVSMNMIFYLMVSFGFVIGIILMVAPEAFENLHKALQREYGLTVKLAPKFENTVFNAIDKAIVKHRKFTGVLLSITAFVLLIVYK